MFGIKARGLLETLDEVVGKLNQVNAISGTINKTMSNAGRAEFFKPVTDKVNQGIDLYRQYQAAEDYVKAQEAQNAKTKEQIDYETRLSKRGGSGNLNSRLSGFFV